MVPALRPQCLLPGQQPPQAGFASPWQRAQSFASPEMCCPEPALPRLDMSHTHRKHGVLLLQGPQGWASPAPKRGTNYTKADPVDTSQSSSHVGASPPQKAPLCPANTAASLVTTSTDPVNPEISSDCAQTVVSRHATMGCPSHSSMGMGRSSPGRHLH